MSRAYRKISLIFWLSSVPFSGMLLNFLQHQLDLTIERIFLLLACLLPYDPVDEYAETIMNADDKDMHANALEVLEGITPRDIWAMLFPLVDPENDLKERLKFGRQFYPGLQESIDATLEEYLLSPRCAGLRSCTIVIVIFCCLPFLRSFLLNEAAIKSCVLPAP
eukprot:SAG22_NODE_113_length_19407_cov_214.925161_5_plen_165_part_00